jgi:hypothetical protein
MGAPNVIGNVNGFQHSSVSFNQTVNILNRVVLEGRHPMAPVKKTGQQSGKGLLAGSSHLFSCSCLEQIKAPYPARR